MSHVEFDRLWALAQGTLGESEAKDVRAHLASCPACGAQLASIELARPMMMPPPVPELSAARWSAIDDKVLSAVAAEMERPSLWRTLRSWWDAPILKPALAFGAMAAVALVVVFATRSGPEAVPEPLPTDPIAVLPGELVNEAAVVSAVDSSAGAVELQADKKIAKGSRIATRAQGEAWLKLPDGSKLGVLAASSAQLDDLSPTAVRVSLDKGALAVAAAYEPDRVLEVSAGLLSVKVVGTRFMVVRDDEKSGVVVEEGMVEANVDGKPTMVPAGSSLTVTNQGVTRLDKVEEPERREMQVIVPQRPLVTPKPPKPLVLPVTDAPDAAVLAMVQPSEPPPAHPAEPEPAAQPAPETTDVDNDWASMPSPVEQPAQPQAAEAQPQPIGLAPQNGVPQPQAVPTAAVAGDRSWLQKQVDKVSRAHCRRVYEKVDEMLIVWPKKGVVMTKRRQTQLNEGLKERDRCIAKWGYPLPK
ncbi:MAG: FecR domain-containing protein [Myxococcales bacterium]